MTSKLSHIVTAAMTALALIAVGFAYSVSAETEKTIEERVAALEELLEGVTEAHLQDLMDLEDTIEDLEDKIEAADSSDDDDDDDRSSVRKAWGNDKSTICYKGKLLKVSARSALVYKEKFAGLVSASEGCASATDVDDDEDDDEDDDDDSDDDDEEDDDSDDDDDDSDDDDDE